MQNVILISGKQGSGKSTLARELPKALFPALCVPVRFANPLYEMQEAIRGVAEKYGIPFDKKEGRLLQLLGTEWGRECKGRDVWVNAIKHRIAAQPEVIFIIEDCRFKNEFDAFPGGLRIRLECHKSTRQARCDGWRDDDRHPSEIDLDEYVQQGRFDAVFYTGLGTPEVIARQVAWLFGMPHETN